MQATEMTAAVNVGERNRVEAVVQTVAALRFPGGSLAELAHDARNMVTALALYCDLLEEPGVLNSTFLHYGSELRDSWSPPAGGWWKSPCFWTPATAWAVARPTGVVQTVLQAAA